MFIYTISDVLTFVIVSIIILVSLINFLCAFFKKEDKK